MLVLKRSEDTYPDHADAAVRYRLPTGLAPLPGPDGTPQAVLTRSPDGGLLHLRLGATWPELRPGDRPVAFAAGRFRLILQTPTARETGRWWPTPIGGNAVVDRSVSLDPIEAAIAKSLGQRTNDLVDAEVELTLHGLAPAFPWLVSVELATLRSRIAALLGATPASWDAVEAAFLGLTEDTFMWHPLEARALRPLLDEALLAIAQYAAPVLLTSTDRGWMLAQGGPSRLDISLAVPRVQTRTIGLRWSFSEFLAQQSDPRKHLVDVAIPAPFVAADLCVVNDVPLASTGIRSIAVEVRTGGPSGMLRHEFRAGEPSAARLRFVRESTAELDIRWRARATIVTASGPAAVETAERSSGLLIEVNPTSLGLKALRFLAAQEVFDHVASLEISVGSRTLTLNAASPEAWAVGREPPTTVTVGAMLASGERHALGAMPIGPMGMTLDAGTLGVGEIAPVVLRPPPDLERRAAYLAVQVEGHPWRTLDPGGELALAVRRESRVQPPKLRYRTRLVSRGVEGATSVMSESAWRDGVGEVVSVDL